MTPPGVITKSQFFRILMSPLFRSGSGSKTARAVATVSVPKQLPIFVGELELGDTFELFPGCKAWSKAHGKIGFRPTWHCWQENPEFNMACKKYTRSQLIPLIKSRRRGRKRTFAAMHIGLECTTYSTMTANLYRTKEEPEMSARCKLCPKRMAKVENANRYTDNAMDAFDAGCEEGTLSSFEQPKGTRLFFKKRMAPIMAKIKEGTLWRIETSYCRWGRKFRGTRVIVANYPEIQELARPCTHDRHAGFLAAHSIPTKEANPYPTQMCNCWAKLTLKALIARGGS